MDQAGKCAVDGVWVAALPLAEASRAARLRTRGEVLVLVVNETLWLRGRLAEKETEGSLMRLLPGVRPYGLADDGQLTPIGGRVPSGWLPQGEWIPLSTWLKLDLPSARPVWPLPPTTVPLTLVRGGCEQSPTWLVCSLADWGRFASTAPQWRLAALAFAAHAAGQVLLRGNPLPALPGIRCVEQGGIGIPVGWVWRPHVQPAVLRLCLGLESGEQALLTPADEALWADSPCRCQTHVIRASDWVAGSRSAALLTVHGISAGA